jgi:hypothetical protein
MGTRFRKKSTQANYCRPNCFNTTLSGLSPVRAFFVPRIFELRPSPTATAMCEPNPIANENMNPKPANKSKPFSIRLTPEERLLLEKRAGAQALGEYIRESLLETKVRRSKSSRGQFPTKDRQALAKALALLGCSSLRKSMSELSEAARIGALPVTGETESQLQKACADIASIKSLIMRALGIQED